MLSPIDKLLQQVHAWLHARSNLQGSASIQTAPFFLTQLAHRVDLQTGAIHSRRLKSQTLALPSSSPSGPEPLQNPHPDMSMSNWDWRQPSRTFLGTNAILVSTSTARDQSHGPKLRTKCKISDNVLSVLLWENSDDPSIHSIATGAQLPPSNLTPTHCHPCSTLGPGS